MFCIWEAMHGRIVLGWGVLRRFSSNISWDINWPILFQLITLFICNLIGYRILHKICYHLPIKIFCNEKLRFLASLMGIAYENLYISQTAKIMVTNLTKVLGWGESERERIFAHARLHLKRLLHLYLKLVPTLIRVGHRRNDDPTLVNMTLLL